MAKKVSEANKGIQALAKKAPEVVKKMGYVMQMGSKENYSPTNFKTKDAMLMGQSPMYMIGGSFIPDVESYERVKNDPLSQQIVNVTKNQKDPYADKMNDLNQGYKQGDYNKSASYDQVMYEAGLGIGKGLKNIFKPKEGSWAEKHQKDRKAARKEIRDDQKGTFVGNKLRDVFRSKKVKNKIK